MDRATAVFRTVNRGLLQDNEALAAYAEAWLGLAGGDPPRAETLAFKALAKDTVPYMTANELDILMAIAVRQTDTAKAQPIAARYASLSRSIPEEGAVRRASMRAAAEAEILAGHRSGDAVRLLPGVLRKASGLGHAEEVAELEHVLAMSRR